MGASDGAVASPSSGGTALVVNEALNLHSALEPGTEYLQIPFTPSVLVNRVRELLSTEDARG